MEGEPWRSSLFIARKMGLFQPTVLEVFMDEELDPQY
jgi:hypothetical protein